MSSISRKELIRKFRAVGYSGPFSGGRHQFMIRGKKKIRIPNPHGASKEDALEKLQYDLFYIKNLTIVLELDIILRTIGVVLFGKGAR